MACSIGENKPLSRLRSDLTLGLTCHSRRTDCWHGLTQHQTKTALAAPGTVLGYCQALFGPAATPEEHTRKVATLLHNIDAPWAQSHELFWGYRRDLAAPTYLRRSIEPLAGTGRVPIVITALDPARDNEQIATILRTELPVASGETILLRLVLRDQHSIEAAAALQRRLLTEALRSGNMPPWWPLFQGQLAVQQWDGFRIAAGTSWPYTNIAVNPFVTTDVLGVVGDQVTVAQVVVGGPGGVSGDCITLPQQMNILGKGTHTSYSISDFIVRLHSITVVPTLILLGPAQPEWSDSDNQQRIGEVLVPLRGACESLWHNVSAHRRTLVWSLPA